VENPTRDSHVEPDPSDTLKEADAGKIKVEYLNPHKAPDVLGVKPRLNGEILDQALYARMRSSMKAGRYKKAIALADEYLTANPTGTHTEEVLYLKAQCQVHLGNLAQGRRLLEKYRTTFPNGRYWKRVNEILGE
jgi:tetratricopeptide (TPR) repeat protein